MNRQQEIERVVDREVRREVKDAIGRAREEFEQRAKMLELNVQARLDGVWNAVNTRLRDLEQRVRQSELEAVESRERIRALERLVDLAVDARIPPDTVQRAERILAKLESMGHEPAGIPPAGKAAPRG